jgi:hypothetical protein
VRHSRVHWLIGALAVVAGMTIPRPLFAQARPAPSPAAQPPAAPQPAFRLTRNQGGDARPVLFDADEIATWNESEPTVEWVVLQVHGMVLVQQGDLRVRFPDGAAWLDLAAWKRSGVMHLLIYAEGGVRINSGSASKDVPRAVIDLTTRGEFRLNAHASPIQRQSRAADPVVQRARAERLGPPLLRQPGAIPGGVQQTGHQGAPTPGPAPAPAPPVWPGARPPAPSATPPSVSRKVEAPATLPPAPAGTILPAAFEDSAPGRTTSNAPGLPGQLPPTSPDLVPPPGNPNGSPLPQPLPVGPPSPGQAGPPVPPGAAPPPLPPGAPVPPGIPVGPPEGPRPDVPPVSPPSRPTPPPPGPPSPTLPPARNYSVSPRQGATGFSIKIEKIGESGEQAIIVTGGVILNIRNAPGIGFIDIESDRLVIWTRGNAEQLATDIRETEGRNSNDLEIYMAGNVVIRQQPAFNPKNESRTLSADEVYYDVSRNVAIAERAQMEIKQPLMQDPLYVRAQELLQTSASTYEVTRAEVFSSKLPSAPSLQVFLRDAVIEDKHVPMTGLFGRPVKDRKTGQPLTQEQTIISGHNLLVDFEKVPVWFLPYTSFDARNPLGPVQNFNWGWNQIFGFQFGLSFNAYQLFGLQPSPRTRWLLNVDYLSYRGPGLGTQYDYSGIEFLGMPTNYTGEFKAFGMYDRGYDVLGGPRLLNNFSPPNFRGRVEWRNDFEDLPNGFNFISQVEGLSDRNFLEQYYKQVFDRDVNWATFGMLKQQQGNWDWSVLAEPHLLPWVTETAWLPRFDGWLIGQDFFNRLTYTSHASATYARLYVTSDHNPGVPEYNAATLTGRDNEPIISPTDVADSTGRFDWMQELAVPFYLGPLKLEPYGMVDTAYYTSALTGNLGIVNRGMIETSAYVPDNGNTLVPGGNSPAYANGSGAGRVWGLGGVRGSIPLSRLYPGIQSELWNVNGIYHKIVASFNFADARSNQPYTRFPQLDRLNDFASDQAVRDIRPMETLLNPLASPALSYAAVYDPQIYAIRRLILSRIDTLSSMEVLQLDVRQRWQTKRGYPGLQHIVDWMVLDVSASYFPQQNRDNFGNSWAFLEYNYLWNIGDRTALTSTAWYDPEPGGPRVYTIGMYFNRPDRTNFYIGYRQIDPVYSRPVTASVTYVFSPKYSITGSTTYDFGTALAMSNSLMFTRMGSDLQVSLGFSYNPMQNNFNFQFNIVPNVLPAGRTLGPMSAGGAGSQGILQ